MISCLAFSLVVFLSCGAGGFVVGLWLGKWRSTSGV